MSIGKCHYGIMMKFEVINVLVSTESENESNGSHPRIDPKDPTRQNMVAHLLRAQIKHFFTLLWSQLHQSGGHVNKNVI